MAERFLYMPSLGFCIILSMLLTKIIKTEIIKSKFKTVKEFVSLNSTLFIIVFIVAGLYSIKTIARSQVWKSDFDLMSHDVESAPNSSRAHNNLAVILFNQYPEEKNEEVKQNLLDKAMIEFKKANRSEEHTSEL